MRNIVVFTAAALSLTAAARAQGTDEPALCTDRPGKATSACTVPVGKIQFETDLVNWTRMDAGGSRVDTIQYTNPTLKLGLGPNTDVQVNISPYEDVRTRAGGVVGHSRGVGDLFIRLKQRFTDPDSKLQIGIVPYVKAPTAKSGIGNREWEGGAVLPVQYSLPQGWSLTFAPELDVLADSDDLSSRHMQVAGAVNVGKALSPTVTAYAELWTAQNYDPVGTVHQYSVDAAIAWLVSPKLQLDLGGNFGLNQATPDAQAYVGLSTRF
ncbi:MAG TPA: transporter [Sphingomonas sp.]|nr:transporter [Sphingomonas sp.]